MSKQTLAAPILRRKGLFEDNMFKSGLINKKIIRVHAHRSQVGTDDQAKGEVMTFKSMSCLNRLNGTLTKTYKQTRDSQGEWQLDFTCYIYLYKVNQSQACVEKYRRYTCNAPR